MQSTKNGKARQSTKADLQKQLAEVAQKLDQAHAQIEGLIAKNKFLESMRSDEDSQIIELQRQLAENETRLIADDDQIVKLEMQLAHAADRLANAEAALLSQPPTATPPPGGHAPESLLAPAAGVMRIWVMTDKDGYRLRLVHLDVDGCGWEMIKWSSGTRYHLFEADGEEITCDCPGGVRHGPRCNSGKGCKHARMLKALRTVVYPAG